MDLLSLKGEIEEAYTSLNVSQKKEELTSLQRQMQDAGFWEDPKKAAKISKQESGIRQLIENWDDLKSSVNDLVELSQLGEDVEIQKKELEAKFNKYSIDLYFSGKFDNHDVVITIQAGAGGKDAQDWANMLYRMYSRWAEKSDIKIELIDQSTNEDGGLKNVTFILKGHNLYGTLKFENGVHRLVRKSPFNSAGSRETSFAMIEILPSIDEPDEVVIDDSDLKIDTYRASGKGGQSVNTTDSAVRITHIPTSIAVAIQNERSQLQNRETAMQIIRSKLAQLQLEQHQEELSKIKGPNKEAAWGNQIRNYVLDPYQLVKDSRSGYETSSIQDILDGDIDEMLMAGIKSQSH